MTKKEQQIKKAKITKAIALFALAIKKSNTLNIQTDSDKYIQKTSNDCPNVEEVAAYCDGQLKKSERQRFRKKMLYCHDSYVLWMAMLGIN